MGKPEIIKDNEYTVCAWCYLHILGEPVLHDERATDRCEVCADFSDDCVYIHAPSLYGSFSYT